MRGLAPAVRAASLGVLGALAATLLAVVVLGVVAGTAPAAPAPTPEPLDELVVALHLPAPGLQVGAVRGRDVVAASGLEIDVARALARRLGARRVRFLQVSDPAALTSAGPKPWHVAIAALEARDRGAVDLTASYLRSDPVVLMRAGLPRPRNLADLRARLLCAVRGSAGAIEARRIRSLFPLLAADGDADLLRLVQTGRCDAALREAPRLGVAMQRIGGRYGPVGGRVETSASWAIAVPRESAVAARVARAISRLRRDGTLGRIAVRWLGFDPLRLRALR
jgi:polar amino acid transport system substrate-binding protein